MILHPLSRGARLSLGYLTDVRVPGRPDPYATYHRSAVRGQKAAQRALAQKRRLAALSQKGPA